MLVTIGIRRFYERIVWRILARNSGQEISAAHLEYLWERLREALKKQGYKVDEISMPHMKALVLGATEYARISRIIDRLPKTRSNTIEEYGQEYSTESAIGTVVELPGNKNEYVVFLSKSRCEHDTVEPEEAISSVSYHLCHELTHVWEHMLKMKPAGSLVKEVFGDRDFVRCISVATY